MSNYYNRQWRLPNSWNGTESNVNKQSNYSMDFDGSSCINITDDPLKDGATNFTLSAWVKADGTVGGSDRSFLQNWVTPYVFLIRYKDNGNFQLYLNGAVKRIDVTLSSLGLVNNNWNHIVIVNEYDNSQIKVYVNGTLQHTETSTQVAYPSNSTPLEIGGDYNYWDGQIDGVSIFNYALSSSQVTTLYGSSSTGIGNPMAISGGGKPVAYYPLGDQDSFNGAEYLTPNASLKDYVFSFSSDLIDSNFSLTTGQTQFSASIWFKLTGSLGNDESLIANESGYSADGFAIFKNASNTIEFRCESQSAIGTTTIALNKWYLATATYNAGAMVLYVNGQQEATQTTATSITQPSTPKTRLGKYITGNVIPFTGELSNAQIFNTALSSTDVETLYNNGSPLTSMSGFTSLQGWWKLDASATYDSSTTTWTIPDDSTNSNDGTSSGMTQANLVQSDLSFTSGYSPYALDFDGTNDYIDCGTSQLVDFSSSFTISAWVYITSTASGYDCVYAFKGASNAFAMFFNNGSGYLPISFGSANYPTDATIKCATNVIINQWNNIVVVYNGNGIATPSNYIFYINNTSQTLTTSAGFSDAGNLNYIGNYGGNYFNGSISNISIWNASLTSSQVTEIYNEGVPSNLNNHSAYSNLVSWWQLGSNSSFNTNWTVLDEKGSNNGTSANMTEDDIVDGVGSYANGTSSGMGGSEIVGNAFGSSANSLSINMDVLDRTEDTPS